MTDVNITDSVPELSSALVSGWLSGDRAEGQHRPLKPGDLKRCRHEFPALDRLE